MPFDGNKWSVKKFVPYRWMLSEMMKRWPQLTRLSDAPNDTSKVSLQKAIKAYNLHSPNMLAAVHRLTVCQDIEDRWASSPQ